MATPNQSRGGESVTRLLRLWAQGDEAALAHLTPIVYAELRKRAGKYMKDELQGVTLQATALANEAWIRLASGAEVNWKDRAHFFAVAAQIMRRILVDGARARHRDKRGGNAQRYSLEDVPEVAELRGWELIAVDDALSRLAEIDPRKAKVIELRFFGGLSVDETAEVLKISGQSVMRDWKLARAWLMREIRNT
jgi:RNA polymerase sigma factor (TIGR02999 family)